MFAIILQNRLSKGLRWVHNQNEVEPGGDREVMILNRGLRSFGGTGSDG